MFIKERKQKMKLKELLKQITDQDISIDEAMELDVVLSTDEEGNSFGNPWRVEISPLTAEESCNDDFVSSLDEGFSGPAKSIIIYPDI